MAVGWSMAVLKLRIYWHGGWGWVDEMQNNAELSFRLLDSALQKRALEKQELCDFFTEEINLSNSWSWFSLKYIVAEDCDCLNHMKQLVRPFYANICDLLILCNDPINSSTFFAGIWYQLQIAAYLFEYSVKRCVMGKNISLE